jgi:hypothetical protein
MKNFSGFTIRPLEGDLGQEVLLEKKVGDIIDLSVGFGDGTQTVPYNYKIVKIFKWSNGNITYMLEGVGWLREALLKDKKRKIEEDYYRGFGK